MMSFSENAGPGDPDFPQAPDHTRQNPMPAPDRGPVFQFFLGLFMVIFFMVILAAALFAGGFISGVAIDVFSEGYETGAGLLNG